MRAGRVPRSPPTTRRPISVHAWADFPAGVLNSGRTGDCYAIFALAVQYLVDPDGGGGSPGDMKQAYLDIRGGATWATALSDRFGVRGEGAARGRAPPVGAVSGGRGEGARASDGLAGLTAVPGRRDLEAVGQGRARRSGRVDLRPAPRRRARARGAGGVTADLRRQLGFAAITAILISEVIAVGISLTPVGMARSIGSIALLAGVNVVGGWWEVSKLAGEARDPAGNRPRAPNGPRFGAAGAPVTRTFPEARGSRMSFRIALAVMAGAATLATACAPAGDAGTAAAGGSDEFRVPVEYHTLDNGLKVVLSEDHTAPTVAVAVYYHIGLRIEPRERTGFAHLFEHMMFQGSENLGKMEFVRLVQENGGILNGSTRFDFTNYFEIVPAHKLETMLWAEADRMRGLAITQDNLTNQQGVVKSEVRVNVLNQPYGGFPWLDLPQHANENWYNAHNFYGDLEDLDAATLEDVQTFFERYYAPSNAALAMVGDFDPEQAMAWVEQYFGDIPAGPAVELPDISEPRQEEEKRATKTDALANRPAYAVGYHMPERNTPEYWAMGLIDQILLQGDDARLGLALEQERGMTGSVSGGINLLGNMFNYDGPMLWIYSLRHDPENPSGRILAAADSVIEWIRTEPVDIETINRARVKLRSQLYDNVDGLFGFGRADLLASFALFDDDPARINTLEARFAEITPELIQRTAQEYLRPTNRTILFLEPGAAAGVDQ